MLEAVAASPGHLLFIAPCVECQHLIPRLRAGGWHISSCDLTDAHQHTADVALVCLGRAAPDALLQLPRHKPGIAGQWLALIQPGCAAAVSDSSGFIDAWYFQRLLKPFDIPELQRTLSAACLAARSPLHPERNNDLLGHSKSIRELRKRLTTLELNRRPVLIEGEPGTGKALLAELIHRRGRAGAELRSVACAELPANPFDGLRGGTLCLQNAELLEPAHCEALLKAASRAGVRLLATTAAATEPLQHLRQSWETVTLTPLRQRQGDIVLLVEHFVQLHSGFAGGVRPFSESALSAMLQHAWPGNVRELAMRVRRALALGNGLEVRAGDLGLHSGFEPGPGATLEDYKRRAEYQALCDALARHSSNLSQAAKSLGISRPTFYRLLHKHQLL